MTLSVALAHAFPGFALDLAFEAAPGLTALVGPSGAGKTSVLHAIAGLLRPDRGRIALGDEVLLDTEAGVMVPPHRRRLACVFQDARLFPHLSVRGNLLYGQRRAPRGAPGPDLATVAELLGLGPLLGRRPRHLSGGERSRVALGRAVLSRPRLLLMDEPLASLDEGLRGAILPFIESLRDEARLPILYVSHAPAEVARLATAVVTMAAGRVTAIGPPSRTEVRAARVDGDRLLVDLSDGRALAVPLALIPGLAGRPAETLGALRIDGPALIWDALPLTVPLAALLAGP